MLPESILEELTRDTALSCRLIEMAWPSLNTESRLQIIQRLQGDSDGNESTPDWLTDLALTDTEPVVRYWAARYANFDDTDPGMHPKLGVLQGASAEQKARTARARADDEALVRFAVDRLFMRDLDLLSAASQTERLVKLRNFRLASLGQFVEWLEKAIAEGLSDDDLQECTAEFFSLPSVSRNFTKDDFSDGMDASYAGGAMRKGWELANVADIRTSIQLARHLPFKHGLGDMTAEGLAKQPDHVLRVVMNRAKTEKVAAELVALIQSRR